jgi:casein kinase II subunit alpha
MFKNQELVNKIDPELTFVRSLYNFGDVYEVEKNNRHFVLKIFDKNNKKDIEHVLTEKKALDLAKDVNGITHLVKDYGLVENKYLPLLKEYIEGENLSYLGKKSLNNNLKNQLKSVLDDLHAAGIAHLDILEKNIVVSSDFSEIKLVDLGCCKFKDEIVWWDFESYKITDREELRNF